MTVERWSDWMAADEASKILGVSVSTLKRRLRAGQSVIRPDGSSVEVEGESIQRPQGHEWRVRLPADLAPLTTDQTDHDSKEPPAVSTDLGDNQAAVSALRELVVMERAERQRLSNELRAESVARATAETRATMLQAQHDDLAAELAAEREARATAESERDAERRKTWWDKLRGR